MLFLEIVVNRPKKKKKSSSYSISELLLPLLPHPLQELKVALPLYVSIPWS